MGSLLTACLAQRAVTFVEESNVEPEEGVQYAPLRTATSRPLWATSTENLDAATLKQVFDHTSTADAEVRRGAALVAAQAVQV